MPTQEERLTALEQKTATHIQEMDENFTIMVGVIRHQGQDIKRIFQRLETMDDSLSTLKSHLNQLETTLDEHTTLLTQILERLPKAP
jgi:DNA repair exonuclease SbcCD ATPase subunit